MKLPFTKLPPGATIKILGNIAPIYRVHKIKPVKWSICSWEPDDPNDRKASMDGVVLPALRAELLRIVKKVGFRKSFKRKLAPPHYGQKYQYFYRPRYKAFKTQISFLGKMRDISLVVGEVRMLGNRIEVNVPTVNSENVNVMVKTKLFYDDPLMLDKFEAEMLKLFMELE